MTGKEVVQVYVRDVVSTVMTPVKQLKGFEKIELRPGEEKSVLVKIPVHELYLTGNFGDRYLEPGEFEIQVGTSSDEIYHRFSIWVGDKKNFSVENSLSENSIEASGEIIRIEGIIRDVQATPIAGVKVEAVGSGQDSVTDGDGCYSLSARSDDALVFTKNGYASQKIYIKGQDKVNVQMTKENN